MKEIPLTQGKVALVDDEDFERINQFKWYARKTHNMYYAVHTLPRSQNQRKLYMHAIIIGTPPRKMTDHINGDGLDNRKENLRVVTNRENLQNLHVKKTSKYPGVRFVRQSKKWRATIQFKGKQYNLGNYSDELTAATVYAVASEVIKMEA